MNPVEFSIVKDTAGPALAKLMVEFAPKVGAALYQEALIEGKEIKQRTPVEFGTLRASLVVLRPVFSGRNIIVVIQMGGAAAPYAVYVHENVEAFHKEGQAKFMESVIKESAPFLLQRVLARANVLIGPSGAAPVPVAA